ncbi:unnamed protein product [Paramecium pentaurelia]|uniref:Band 7 domain-containing protein n=1 Tax=Paramecium pentaurelia TaxID=43138 RepID=A0A8S1XUA5_9CILI|nr:unnamed protein product [Paramecium pentaurelia]
MYQQNQVMYQQHPNQQIPVQQHRDYNVPPPGYKAPRYPREELPENQEQNLDLGGSYQSYLYNCGECCGNCKAVCPCNPFVEYPYVQVEQSFVGVYLRFGKYIKTVQPGLIYINPCTDTIQKVDCKVQMIDCPRQQVMTKDNILVSIDATVYYRIVIPRRSIFYINDLHQAVTQLTLATIKSIAGSHTLQDLLEKRAEVQQQIEGFVDEHVWEWGIDIENMLIKDIQLNADLQNTLSMAAKEQRAAQAKVISAQGDVQSAKLMRQAAELLDSKAAMQIRYLDTITTLGQQGSTKVVLLPTDSK